MAGFLLLDLLIRFWVVLAGRHPDPDRDRYRRWPGSLKETYWRFIDTSSAVPSTSRAPPRSAAAAGSACSNRRIPRPITCCRKWASASPASTAPGCASIARLAAFALPGLLTLVALFLAGWIGAVLAGLAVASAALGLVVERWLFFAEAKHTVTLYYGADAA